MIDHRESVSAAIHGAALIAAFPALLYLLREAGTGLRLRAALIAYGLGLIACFAASTACHGVVALGSESRLAVMLDHMAIYLMIAGTYTPIVVALLPPHLGRPALATVWAAACVGVGLNLRAGPLPRGVATSFYLAMGWGGLWCYARLLSSFSHRQLAPMPIGGALYSVGATFHLLRWPLILPGYFGAHELFHVFVVLGASTHFAFMRNHVVRRRAQDRDGVDGPRPPGRHGLVAGGPIGEDDAEAEAIRGLSGSRMHRQRVSLPARAAWGSRASRRSPGATPPPPG